jgi:hypothetical protein
MINRLTKKLGNSITLSLMSVLSLLQSKEAAENNSLNNVYFLSTNEFQVLKSSSAPHSLSLSLSGQTFSRENFKSLILPHIGLVYQKPYPNNEELKKYESK